MNKLQKILLGLFISAISCIILYYGILFSLPNFIDLNKYKEDIFTQVQKETGFKISSEDISIQRSLSPEIKIKLFHTLVLYPDDSEFVKLKDAELKVKLFPLLLKRVEIKDAKLIRPIINITMYKDFSTSLDKYKQETLEYSVNGFKVNKIVSDINCERYKLKINDKTINKTFYLEGDELLLKDIKLNEKIRFVLKGGLFENKNQYLNYDLDITAPFVIPEYKYTFSPFKTIYESKIKGNISGKLIADKNQNINGNLNINDISLIIKGEKLENNNINLLFKGREVEIASVLHTSQTDEANINGKFNYGNSKRIDLTTKAKNIDLENLQNIISIVAKSLNLHNKYKDIKLVGLLDADFNVSSDFKTLKSRGNASLINAQIKYANLPYSISDINSNINFNNNKINIENAELKINETPLSLTGVVNEDVTLNLNAKAENLDLRQCLKIFDLEKNVPLDIHNGKISFTSNITGDLNNIKTNTNIVLGELFAIDKTYKLPIKATSIDVNLNTLKEKFKGSIVLNNAKVVFNKIPFESERLNFIFNENLLTLPENFVKVGSSNFKIAGNVKDYLKTPSINVDFDGSFLSSELAQILKKYIKEPYKANGYISTVGNIKTKAEGNGINIKLFANKDNYISYAVIRELLDKPSVLNLSCVQKDNTFNISDVSLYENNTGNIKTEIEKLNKTIYANGTINIEKEPTFNNFKISIPQKMSIATNFFGGEDISLKADVVLNGTINEPKLNGVAKLYRYNLKKYLTAIKDADITFADKKWKIVAPDVQVNNSKLNIITDVSLPIAKTINLSNLQVNCHNLDLNTLFPLFESLSNSYEQYIVDIKNGTLTVNNFQILDLKANDISADISTKNNLFKLSNIKAMAYSGEVEGNINYNFDEKSLALALKGKALDIKNTIYDLCKFQDNIAGVVDFSTDIKLKTGLYEEVLKSITGNIDFVSLNGRMGTLGKFDYYLSAQNILYHGFFNTSLNRIVDAITKDNTSQYKIAKGKIEFENGYMKTENLQAQGKDMSLFITGNHNMLSNQSSILINGRISDNISSKLGSFGDLSISDFLENPKEKANYNIEFISPKTIEQIPSLSTNVVNTKTFKVNIIGNMQALNSINSFMWTLPNPNEIEEKGLPEFSDITQEI